MKLTGQVLLLPATGQVNPQVKLLINFAETIFLHLSDDIYFQVPPRGGAEEILSQDLKLLSTGGIISF